MSALRTLEFQNPTFHGGVNVTVRKGDKWSTVELGDVLAISPVGFAQVVFVMRCRLRDIPEALLAMEHDPSCHDHKGLAREMRKVYCQEWPNEVPLWDVEVWPVTVLGLRIFQEM